MNWGGARARDSLRCFFKSCRDGFVRRQWHWGVLSCAFTQLTSLTACTWLWACTSVLPVVAYPPPPVHLPLFRPSQISCPHLCNYLYSDHRALTAHACAANRRGSSLGGGAALEVLTQLLLPPLVWRAGKTAAAVRFAAMTALATMLRRQLVPVEALLLLVAEGKLLPLLHQCLDEVGQALGLEKAWAVLPSAYMPVMPICRVDCLLACSIDTC